MSTTFGIKKDSKQVEIAFRSSNGIHWLNDFGILEDYLIDNKPVEALDNTPQGIYTIKDLKQAINK